jgi:hypothetical protein
MTALSDLAAKHWFMGGIGVSLMWFAAGKQSLSNRFIGATVHNRMFVNSSSVLQVFPY